MALTHGINANVVHAGHCWFSWRRRTASLNGKTPRQAIEQGHGDKVIELAKRDI